MDDDISDEVEYLLELLKTQNISCATVKDGHIIIFKRSYLQSILDNNPDNETIMMFIKRPVFQD